MEENKEIYRVYTSINYADTSRDPDNIHIEELGFFDNKEKAISIASNFIENNFFNKNTKIRELKNGNFSATDFCSYGKTIYVIKIKVETS